MSNNVFLSTLLVFVFTSRQLTLAWNFISAGKKLSTLCIVKTSDALTNVLLHKITLNDYRLILSTWHNVFLVLIYDSIYENRVKTLHQNSGHVFGKLVRYKYMISCENDHDHNRDGLYNI